MTSTYDRWLQLFFSPVKEVFLKGGKKKLQSITKSWQDDGSIRISGSKPSAWTVILRPSETTDMRAYLHLIKKEKERSVMLMKEAFKDIDEKMFREGEQRYQIEEKKERKIKDILEDYRKSEIQMAERLFQAQRSLYLLTRKRRESRKDFTATDKKALERLNNDVRDITKEAINQRRTFQMRIKQYSPNVSSIKEQGPVPTPPDIPSLPLGVSRRRVILNNTNNNNESNESNESNLQKGGDVKIIRL